MYNTQIINYELIAGSKLPNIWDYIQVLISCQVLPQVDGFIDRDEELKHYDDAH